MRHVILPLASLSASMFALGTAALFVIGLEAPIRIELGVSSAAIGALITAFAFTYALASPLVQAALGGRLKRRTMILGGLALLTAGTLWSALAADFPQLLLSRIAMAVGGALVGATSLASGAALVPAEQRGRALSLVFAGFTLRTVLGLPLATWLGITVGWRTATAAVAVIALLSAAAVAATLDDRGIEPPLRLADLASLLTHLPILANLAASLLQVAGQFVIYSLMSALLSDFFGLPMAMLAVALLAFGFGGVLGNMASGSLTDRIGPRSTAFASFSILCAGFAALWLPLSPLLAVAVLAACAFGGNAFTAPQLVRLTAAAPGGASAATLALNASAGYLGIATGSAVAAVVQGTWGFAALPGAALALLGCALAAFCLADKRTAVARSEVLPPSA